MPTRQRDTTAGRRSPVRKHQQAPNFFLRRVCPTYRRSAAAASGNPEATGSGEPVVPHHGREPGRPRSRPRAAASCNGLLDSNRCDVCRALERQRPDQSPSPPVTRATWARAGSNAISSPAWLPVASNATRDRWTANNHHDHTASRCPLLQPYAHPPRSRSPIRA
jgi:hypothetical protein